MPGPSGPSGSSGPPSPQPGAATTPDGPPANPPPDLLLRPEPPPQVEPIRSGGPNKPYEVLGQRYTPLATDTALAQAGLASWYGRKFHGRPTASGEIYDMYALSAAHRTMPIPSWALVRNPANGREVVVRINDRGPFHADRIIDLSYAAAARLGVLRGVAPVELRRLTHDDIRSGRWRGDGAPGQTEAQAWPPAAATLPVDAALGATVAPGATAAPAAPANPAAAARAPTPAAAGFWVQLAPSANARARTSCATCWPAIWPG